MSTALGGGWRTPVRQGVAAKPLFYYKPPLVMLVLVKDRYDACFNCSLRFAHCSLKKNPAVAGFFYRAGAMRNSTRRLVNRPMSSWLAMGRAAPRPTINMRFGFIPCSAK